jgi:hypothetical protein
MSDFAAWAQIAQNVAVTVAILVGGVWTLYQVSRQRRLESGLSIGAKVTWTGIGEARFLVYIDISLQNIGNRLLRAHAKRGNFEHPLPLPGRPGAHQHFHSVALHIRRIEPTAIADLSGIVVDWHDTKYLSEISDIGPEEGHEIDLIRSYEQRSKSDGIRVAFFMEPQEMYHLGTSVVLSPGQYMGRVTFFGSRGSDEFWDRTFSFNV